MGNVPIWLYFAELGVGYVGHHCVQVFARGILRMFVVVVVGSFVGLRTFWHHIHSFFSGWMGWSLCG